MVMPVLRAVVRDELRDVQLLSLGCVTDVVTNADGSGARNVEVNARLHGSELELQRVPVMCGRIGMSVAPRIGDTVVLAFISGDLNGAIVLGCIHDDQQHPPTCNADDLVYAVPDDGSGAKRIEVRLAGGNTLTVQDDTVTISLGATSVKVESDGAVTIAAATDLVFKAKGDITIEAGRDFSVRATNATMNADVNATVQAGAAAALKGAVTSIAGQTSFSMG